MRTSTKPAEQFIRPEALYRRAAGLRALGLGRAIIRASNRRGIELRCWAVGKQKLTTGADLIEFCRRVAEEKATEAAS